MKDVLRIAVCDDNAADRGRLKKILQESEAPTETVYYMNAEQLLAEYVPYRFDLILMNILTGKKDDPGVKAISRIRKAEPRVPVAFVTTGTEFTMESNRLSSLSNIVKPYEPDKVQAILRLAGAVKNSLNSLHVHVKGEEIVIPFGDVEYCEQVSHQSHIVRHGLEPVRYYGKIRELYPSLDKSFFYSPHTSYCVNFLYVSGIDTELRCFRMADGMNIPIRRQSFCEARDKYADFRSRQVWAADPR